MEQAACKKKEKRKKRRKKENLRNINCLHKTFYNLHKFSSENSSVTGRQPLP